MNNELDAKLCSKYPKMFANRYADMQTTAMCWGFDHGDGWYNIIDALCSNIQHHIDWRERQIEVATNHNKMVASMKAGDFSEFDKMSQAWASDYKERMKQDYLKGNLRQVPESIPQVVVDQVKEKFGTLRFYYTGGDDAISGMVRMAESMSAVTCEDCGTPGRRRGSGWVRTLCDTHAEQAGYHTTEEEDNAF